MEGISKKMTDKKLGSSDEVTEYINLLTNKIELMEKARIISQELISKLKAQIELLKEQNELLKAKKE